MNSSPDDLMRNGAVSIPSCLMPAQTGTRAHAPPNERPRAEGRWISAPHVGCGHGGSRPLGESGWVLVLEREAPERVSWNGR